MSRFERAGLVNELSSFTFFSSHFGSEELTNSPPVCQCGVYIAIHHTVV